MPSPEDTFCRMLWRIKHDVSRASLFAKHEKPTNTHEMLGQTRNAQQYPRNAQQNTKSPPIPTKCSAKREMPTNTYEMLSKTRKALTKNHKKAPPPQRPKPHHLMKCEQGTWLRHVPCSHFGGRGGPGPPTQKRKVRDRQKD